MVEKVSKGEVIAFRLGASGLLERAAASELPDVAGRCGIQNSPPGSALLALHARVQGMTQELLDAAFVEEKSLIQMWCMRGAPYFIPTADAAVFTTGVLPPTEESMRHFLLGVGPDVDRLGMSLTEAVELLAAGASLPPRYGDHELKGKWLGHRECHITPNWLLVYKKHNDILVLTLSCTGTHSDLFKK